MKVIDTNEYLSVIRELVQQGKEVSLIVTGNSMEPFLIHQRDTICFKNLESPIKVGDMVFYQRTNGKFVMHRVYKVKSDELYMLGDAQRTVEGPIKESQVFAVVTKVKRNGKWLTPGSFWWEFFARFWIRIVPIRRIVLPLCTRRKHYETRRRKKIKATL